jgi:hypothetical protein
MEIGAPYTPYTTGRYQIQRDYAGHAVVVMPLAQFESLYHEMEQLVKNPVRIEVRIEANWNELEDNQYKQQELLNYVQRLREAQGSDVE